MLGFVRALWSAFDRRMRWHRALVLGFAEQGANVLLPAGGAGGPALGALVLTRLGVPADLAAGRHAALFLVTSAVELRRAAVLAGADGIGLLPQRGRAAGDRGAGDRRRARDRAGGELRPQRRAGPTRCRPHPHHALEGASLHP